MKKILLAVAALAVVAVIAWTVTDRNPAPAVQYQALDGRTTSTEALKGRVVLVNFWATSCPGCIKEMPALKDTHTKYAPKGYETVAVAMSYDPPDYVKTYVEQNRLPFFVALDSQGQLAQAFGGVQLTPTSILVGKDGQIIKRYLGEPDSAELHRLIEQALAA